MDAIRIDEMANGDITESAYVLGCYILLKEILCLASVNTTYGTVYFVGWIAQGKTSYLGIRVRQFLEKERHIISNYTFVVYISVIDGNR